MNEKSPRFGSRVSLRSLRTFLLQIVNIRAIGIGSRTRRWGEFRIPGDQTGKDHLEDDCHGNNGWTEDLRTIGIENAKGRRFNNRGDGKRKKLNYRSDTAFNFLGKDSGLCRFFALRKEGTRLNSSVPRKIEKHA